MRPSPAAVLALVAAARMSFAAAAQRRVQRRLRHVHGVEQVPVAGAAPRPAVTFVAHVALALAPCRQVLSLLCCCHRGSSDAPSRGIMGLGVLEAHAVGWSCCCVDCCCVCLRVCVCVRERRHVFAQFFAPHGCSEPLELERSVRIIDCQFLQNAANRDKLKARHSSQAILPHARSAPTSVAALTILPALE